MKKIFAILLSLALMLSLAVPAMADGTTPAPGPYSITIKNTVEGYTYAAYQIFKGDLSEAAENDNVANTHAKLSNIQWGTDVTYNGTGVTVGTGDAATTSTKAADIAAALAGSGLNLDDFLKDLTLVKKSAETSTCNNGEYVISGLTPGYYLVKNETVPTAGSYTEYIVEVVENSTVSPKGSVPEFVKKVDDKNDSNTTEDAVVWQDSADYDIGDDVPFQLKATLADNVSEYATYKVVFHDTLSKGLTYNEADDGTYEGTYKVYLGDDPANRTDVTRHFSITVGEYSETTGTEISFTCNNVKAFNATNESVITVEYNAELNENANIGDAGNPNVAYLEYSNNPNWAFDADNDGIPDDEDDDDDNDNTPDEKEEPGKDKPEEPTGETPEDKVIVFTYKVIVNKVDGEQNPLEGAEFTLYKKNSDGEYVAIGGAKDGEKPEGGVKANQFSWVGLDDGDYKLVESTTPAGYNTIAPIEFTIYAEHDTNSDDPKLTKLTGDLFTGLVDTDDVLSADVINNAGTTLPETGGMGTTIFYAVGGVMVAAAAILLITKKRMSAEG